MLNFDVLFTPVVRVIAIVAIMLIPVFFVITKRKNKVSDALLLGIIFILEFYPLLSYFGKMYEGILTPVFIHLINSSAIARAVSLSFAFKGISSEIENFNIIWLIDTFIIFGMCMGILLIDRNENVLNFVALPYIGGYVCYHINKWIYQILGKLPPKSGNKPKKE